MINPPIVMSDLNKDVKSDGWTLNKQTNNAFVTSYRKWREMQKLNYTAEMQQSGNREYGNAQISSPVSSTFSYHCLHRNFVAYFHLVLGAKALKIRII